MLNLGGQRCLNHYQHEAVARCPECRQFFCRECITEHDDRVICAACLRKLASVPLLKRRGFAEALSLGQFLFGLLAAWFLFYLAGETLLRAPASFHEGSVWKSGWLDNP